MEQRTGSKLGKEYVNAVYCHPAYLSHMQSSVQLNSTTQSCPTLCDPMDCSLPGSSAHGICQARVLEWVAIPFNVNYLYKELFSEYSHIESSGSNIQSITDTINSFP